MKKKKLIATLCSFVLIVCVCTMCVMAASTATANIVANISYTAKGNVKSTIDLSQGVENETTSDDINQYVVPDNTSTYPESEDNSEIVSTGTSTEQTEESPSIAGATSKRVMAWVWVYDPNSGKYVEAFQDFMNSFTINGKDECDQFVEVYTTSSSLRLSVQTHPYYEFEGFYDSLIASSPFTTSTSYTYNISSDVTIVAKFVPKLYKITVTHSAGVASHKLSTTFRTPGNVAPVYTSSHTYSLYYREGVQISFTYQNNYTWKSFYGPNENYGHNVTSETATRIEFFMGYKDTTIEPSLKYTGSTSTGTEGFVYVSSFYSRPFPITNDNIVPKSWEAGMGDFADGHTHDYDNYQFGRKVTLNTPIELVATPEPGFVFKCWATSQSMGTVLSYSSTYLHTFKSNAEEVYAIFTRDYCTLTINVGENMISSGYEAVYGGQSYQQDRYKAGGDTLSVDLVKGSTVTLRSTPADSYVFDSYVNSDGEVISQDENYSFKINEHTSLTSTSKYLSFNYDFSTSYTDNGLDFTTNTEIGGQVSGEEDGDYSGSTSVYVENNGSCSIYAKANTGYAFLGFNSAKDGTGASYNATESSGVYSYTFSNITSNNTIYAIFAKTYTVNIQIDDGVGNVVGSLSGTFYVGQQLNLNDTSIFDLTIEDGYVFDGWELVSGSLPSGFEVDSIEQSNSLIMPSGDFTVKATTKLANRIVFDGTEIVASGSFDLGNINLSIPEGSQNNVVYWYSLTVTNNYTTDDTFDKTYLKITFNLPTDALGETAVLTVKYLNANGDDNTSAWSTISDGKQHFVLAPTGTAGQDNIATIVVTFEINAESSASANLASSIILEACDENGLTAEELSTNNSAIVSDNSSSSLENNLLDFQDVILNNNSNENLNLIFYLKEIV